MTVVLLEERSHLLPPFIILIATLPFTRQTSSPLAWAQERRDVERNLPFISPRFFVAVSTAAEARQKALGRRKREREWLCLCEREKALCIVYSVIHSACRWLAKQTATPSLGEAQELSLSRSHSLYSRAHCGVTDGCNVKKLPGWGVKFKLLLSGALFGFHYDVLLRLPETSRSLREANEAEAPRLPFINSCSQWARTW